MQTDKLLAAVALCRRAGKLHVGFDATVAAAKEASLIVISSDIAERTRRNVQYKCGHIRIVQLPRTKEDIERAVGRQFVVAAVCDTNFAQLIEKNL